MKDRRTLDLNADLGEGFGAWSLGDDEALLKLVSSANVACGVHAGDPDILRRTIDRALELGVSVGAHPSYPDRQGFGRRAMALTPAEIENWVLYQIGALQAFLTRAGATLAHVKAHGALYHRVHADRASATAFVRAVQSFGANVGVYSMSQSVLTEVARDAGVRVIHEFFADRNYRDARTLVSRSEAGAVISDVDTMAARVHRAIVDGEIECIDGRIAPIEVETICVHGDSPAAIQGAQKLRTKLEDLRISIAPPQSTHSGRMR